MKQFEQSRARVLRAQGNSIKEIAKELSVSQSTVSRWCKDIHLSESQQAALDTRRRSKGREALMPWIERNKKLKEKDVLLQSRLGLRDAGTLSLRDLQMVGLGLYWGEGYKRGSQELGFTNSDPRMIRFVLKWLNHTYDVDTQRIIARITINELHHSRTRAITRHWSKETGIPLSQFSKPSYISGYGASKKVSNAYTGTLRIKVRNGTSLRRRILASIEALN